MSLPLITDVNAGIILSQSVGTSAIGGSGTITSYGPLVLPENQPPSISLTVPDDTATFSAPTNITITANATDPDGSIAKVEFFNSGLKIGECLSAPYSIDYSAISASTCSFTAKAVDNDGAETSSDPVTIFVTLPSPPTVISVSTGSSSTKFNNARRIVRDTSGNLYFAYGKVYNGALRIFVSKSTDWGASWVAINNGNPMENVGNYNQGAASLIIDSNNVLHCVWSGRDAGSPYFPQLKYSFSTNNGISWSGWANIQPVPGTGQELPSLAIDSSDTLHCVWQNGSMLTYSSRPAGGAWSQRIIVQSSGGSFPSLAVDPDDKLHCVWYEGPPNSAGAQNCQIRYSYKSATASSWSPYREIQRIEGYGQYHPSLSVDSTGKLHCVWYGVDPLTTGAQIKYSSSVDGITWSNWINLAPISGYNQEDPSLVIDRDDNLYCVWDGNDSLNTSSPQIKLSKNTGSGWSQWVNITNGTSNVQRYVTLRYSGWFTNGGGLNVGWENDAYGIKFYKGDSVVLGQGFTKTPVVSVSVPDMFNYTYSMNLSRGVGASYSVTRLNDGRVLAAGGNDGINYLSSAEIYDPSTGLWTAVNPMPFARGYHCAELLSDGRVLIAGGLNSGGLLASAVIFDPASGSWSTTGSLSTARAGLASAVLSNGKVLTVGGWVSGAGDSFASAASELYDPATGIWSPTGSLQTARMWSGTMGQALLLPSGKVLITGGMPQGVTFTNLATAELYDPSTGLWSYTGSMAVGRRHSFSLTLLSSGKALVAGGILNWNGPNTDKAEVYDAASGVWTSVANMPGVRADHCAELLADGKLLVTGGSAEAVEGAPLNTALLYNPETSAWTNTGTLMKESRKSHHSVRLADNRVLLLGGYGLSSCEIYGSSAPVILPDTTPPSVPQLLFPVNNSISTQTAIAFDWTDSTDSCSGISIYEFNISNSQSFSSLYFSTASYLSRLNANLAAGTTYFWRVRALDTAGNYSDWSTASVFGISLPPPPPPPVDIPPAVVTSLSARATATPGQVILSWAMPGDDGWSTPLPAGSQFAVRYSHAASSGTEQVSVSTSGVTPGTMVSYTLNSLKPGTSYFFQVLHADAALNWSQASNTAFALTVSLPPPPDTTPPSVPQLLFPVNNSISTQTAIAFDWTDSTDSCSEISIYEFNISNSQSFSSLYFSTAAYLSRLNANLAAGTSYFWRVRALDTAGNYSAWANASVFDISLPPPPVVLPPEAVTALSALALDDAKIQLDWEPSISSDTVSYCIYYAKNVGDISFITPKAVVSHPGNRWTSPCFTPGKTYYFIVRAINASGLEEKNLNIVSAATVLKTAGSVRAAIKTPKNGKKISGNRMMIMAELINGDEENVKQVLFEYNKAGSGAWLAMPAANKNHPNPDRSAPYFIHLDADNLDAGAYELRAVATDIYGVADKSPEHITVIIDHNDPDICEGTNHKGEQEKKEKIDTSKDNTIETADGDKGKMTQVVLPGGSIDCKNTKVSIVIDPVITVKPPERTINLCEFREITLENATLTGKAGIVIAYKDDDNNDIVDGSEVPLAALRVFAFNSKTKCWEKLPTDIDKKNKTATGHTTHFSLFALFGAPALDYSAARVYPNPFKPSLGHTYIKLDNLTMGTDIKIFTLSGGLVYEKNDIDSGEFIWEAANQSGRAVASGVYICLITNDLGEKKLLKLAVIR